MQIKNARDYGFFAGNDPEKNAIALQKALEGGGEVLVTDSGDYALSRTVVIESNTVLRFSEGVRIVRTRSEGYNYCYTFVNAGAYTREYDENIVIEGLELVCNGLDVNSGNEMYIPGLRGMISFFYIKGLVVRNLKCMDLLTGGFCVHICTFENILVEDVVIEGKKDGVHLGRGKNFVIRNGRFRTFDDPIALNAHDYATSNPQLGWIEDGLIEDCYDLDDDTTGFFCRILAGSWCDWHKGMVVQHSDSVVCNGRVYRVIMKPDNEVYTSVTPPSHEKGIVNYDGINWCMVQDDVIYSCGCRNVVFRNIHLCKKRDVAFSIHFDDDRWSRSVYPGSVMPVQENLVFENIRIENEIETVLWTVSPAKNVVFKDTNALPSGKFVFASLNRDGLEYPVSDITFDNVGFCNSGEIICAENRKVELLVKNSRAVGDDGFKMTIDKNVNVIEADILTEVKG